MSKLNGKRFILFVEDEYEDLELWYPKIRLIEEGAETVVAGPEKGKLYRGKHGYPCKSDVSFDEVNPDSFDGIVIPGGYAPDKIRRHKKALDIEGLLVPPDFIGCVSSRNHDAVKAVGVNFVEGDIAFARVAVFTSIQFALFGTGYHGLCTFLYEPDLGIPKF